MAASMANTPKKICSGRNPKAEDPNDFCRCCKGSLKVRYGDSWKWTSSENLFLPSKKKGLEGTILADVLEQKTGIVAEKISSLSARLCLICATKIRKTSEGFYFIVSTLNVVNPKFFQLRDPEVEVTNVVPRAKRALSTSVSTPERSPGQKKMQKTRQSPAREKRNSARKSLGSQFCSWLTENEDAILNIDDMISSEQSTRIKVVVLWPNGRTDVRVPDRKENINLLKNVAFKNWQAVANAVLQHSELRQDILKALWRRLNAEFKEYCSSDSVLKHRTPEELIAFSNSSVVEEVSTKCPFWSSCISGACGVEMKESRNVNNAIALATSVLARVRNQSMSALAYRVSSILFHSGVSSQDLIRLNRMGICMSPQMILSLQRDLGKNFDAKIISYKKAMEKKPTETRRMMTSSQN